jgi:cell cycle arrest protein BUB2
MPSQLEAFACFSNFIENTCPLYVQPTLVGVHRGLKVSYHTPIQKGVS